MSDYLKKRERERKLEKIRGKAKNGNGTGNGGAISAAAREHFFAAFENGLFAYAAGSTIVFEIYDSELERFPEIRKHLKVRGGDYPLLALDEKTWQPKKVALDPREHEDEHNEPENLQLYLENTGELHGDMTALRKALVTQRKRGTYDQDKALSRFLTFTNKGARRYAKENSLGAGYGPFTDTVRKRTARHLLESFESAAGFGEFDYLAD